MWSLGRYMKSLLSPAWNGENCKMVIIIRTDISMGKGKIGAQCAHAALECCRQISNNKKNRQMFQSWLRIGQPKIVLRASNQEELLTLMNKACHAGLITAVIKDAGRTQVKPGTITAVGIGPGSNEVIDSLTSKLRLL